MSAEGTYNFERVSIQAVSKVPQDILLVPGFLRELLEQLRFLEQGRRVLCVEVEARGRAFWELNNPSDVSRIESMLAEMGVA